VDLEHFLESVVKETNANASAYSANFSPGTPVHAAPFFGRADVAYYATVGLNPAPAEFQQGRWPAAALPTADHLSRLLQYFANPNVPYYKSWFGTWERALKCLGRSYFQDTAHFDLSPRATIPVGGCPDRQRFVKMVAADLKWFFTLLAGRTEIRGLLVAGSSWCITRSGKAGAVHLDRIIREAGPSFGFALAQPNVLSKSGTRLATYSLTRPGGDSIPVFFCGASPSSNSPEVLVQAVQGHAAMLKHLGF
jgi:hypothetical protein